MDSVVGIRLLVEFLSRSDERCALHPREHAIKVGDLVASAIRGSDRIGVLCEDCRTQVLAYRP